MVPSEPVTGNPRLVCRGAHRGCLQDKIRTEPEVCSLSLARQGITPRLDYRRVLSVLGVPLKKFSVYYCGARKAYTPTSRVRERVLRVGIGVLLDPPAPPALILPRTLNTVGFLVSAIV